MHSTDLKLLLELIERHLGGLAQRLLSLDLAIYMGLFAACLVVEVAVMGWQASSLRRLFCWTGEARRDALSQLLWCSGVMQYTIQFSVLLLPRLLPLFLLGALPARFLPLRAYLPVWVHALLYMLVADFFAYWTHRLSHAWPVWWRLHGYHHAATEFNISTGVRLHPLDVGAMELLRCLPLALIGPPIEEVAILVYARSVIDFLQHSMLLWNYGWYILISIYFRADINLPEFKAE